MKIKNIIKKNLKYKINMQFFSKPNVFGKKNILDF